MAPRGRALLVPSAGPDRGATGRAGRRTGLRRGRGSTRDAAVALRPPLVEIAEALRGSPAVFASVMPMVERNQLERRVLMILDVSRSSGRGRGVAIASPAILVATVLGAAAAAAAAPARAPQMRSRPKHLSRVRCALAIALIFLLRTASHAQRLSPPLDRNDPALEAILTEIYDDAENARVQARIPGMSIVIVYDQDVLLANGFGYADLEKQIPADPQTVYRIGSVTKAFTALMLMQLRDDGKLHLDDPIEKYLPEFKIKSRFP